MSTARATTKRLPEDEVEDVEEESRQVKRQREAASPAASAAASASASASAAASAAASPAARHPGPVQVGGAGAGAGAAAESPEEKPSEATPRIVFDPTANVTRTSKKVDDWIKPEDRERILAAQAEIIRKRGDKPIRLYSDGIFDMFHYGHARALEQAKKLFPNSYLLVGCCNDELTHRYKGLTVMNDQERYESLRHCRWVDEVVTDAPWVLDDEFIKKHDIDFVCHDAEPYADASGSTKADIYHHIKQAGRFCGTQRTEGVSTTGVIVRIIHDYDEFVRRNISRGISRTDMNVPLLKAKAIEWDMAVDKAKKNVKEWSSDMGTKTKEIIGDAGDAIEELAEKAEEVQQNFLNLFNRDSTIRAAMRKGRRKLIARISSLARESLV